MRASLLALAKSIYYDTTENHVKCQQQQRVTAENLTMYDLIFVIMIEELSATGAP